MGWGLNGGGWGYPGGFCVVAVGNVAGVGVMGVKVWGFLMFSGCYVCREGKKERAAEGRRRKRP